MRCEAIAPLGQLPGLTAHVALATCDVFPRLAEDDAPLADQLRRRGITVEAAVWDDPTLDWTGYELVVIRSTWDYTNRREQFVSWAESLSRVLNSAAVLRWNTDKRYLGELAQSVPTRFLAPGDLFEPPSGEYVIKPVVSAGSRDTARYGSGDEATATAHVTELLRAGRTVMVQPYLASVDTHGETALVFFGGEYSHAIRKGQLLHRGTGPVDGLYAVEDIAARAPSAAERAAAEDVLDSLPWPRSELLYARVDLIRASNGSPQLVELELTEPSLFLSYGDGAAERLAGEIIARL